MRNNNTIDASKSTMGRKECKEVIHSGHFMVSDFDAIEAQDEEVLVEIPDSDKSHSDDDDSAYNKGKREEECVERSGKKAKVKHTNVVKYKTSTSKSEALSIDGSLTKLFNAMDIAYKQKITSPKWNRFKGLKLQCKDKIRLNNVIWRCWHMQFILKKKMRVCQFALDVDMHNRPETIVMEGKYWKRKTDAITAEYKKWRIYYKNKLTGCEGMHLHQDDQLSRESWEKSQSLGEKEMKWMMSLDGELDWLRLGSQHGSANLFDDLDSCVDFNDLLFTSLMNAPQPYPFPNPREIARTGNSDLVQPGLLQLQPNLEDEIMMEIAPLTEMLTGGRGGQSLPSVPEEDYYTTEVEAAGLPPSTDTATPPSFSSSTSSPQSLDSYLHQHQAKLSNTTNTTHPHHHPHDMSSSPTTASHHITGSSITYTSDTPPSNYHTNYSSIESPPSFPPCLVFPPPTPMAPAQSPLSLSNDSSLQTPSICTPKILSPMHPSPSSYDHPSHAEDLSTPFSTESLPSTISPGVFSAAPLALHQVSSMRDNHSPGRKQPHELLPNNLSLKQQQQQPPSLPTDLSHHQQQQVSSLSQQRALHPHLKPLAPNHRLIVKCLSQQNLTDGSINSAPLQSSSSTPLLLPALSSSCTSISTPPSISSLISSSSLSSYHHTATFVVPKTVPPRKSSGGSSGSNNNTGSSPLTVKSKSPHILLHHNNPQHQQYHLVRSDTKHNTASTTPLILTTKGEPCDASSGQLLLNPSSQQSQPLKLSLVLPSNNIPPALIPLTTSPHNNNTLTTFTISPAPAPPPSSSLFATPVALTTAPTFVPTPPVTSSSTAAEGLRLSAVTPSSIKAITAAQIYLNSTSSTTNSGANFSLPTSFKCSPPHACPSPAPSPPSKSFRPKSDQERVQYREHRRVCHINAEKKRRCSIKNNFEVLHSLIPALNSTANSKTSKAALLNKGAEYIQQLKNERQQVAEQIDNMKIELEKLSGQISTAQSQLPATGAPMSHSHHNQLEKMYHDYVRERTLHSWKFYLFSMIGESLLQSYNANVSTGSVEDLSRSSMAWLDQHCSLNLLRPLVSSTMLRLSTCTNVLANPQNLPEDIYSLVAKQEDRHSNNNSGSSSNSSRSNSLVRQ